MLSIAMIFIPSAVFWSIGRPLAALGALFLHVGEQYSLILSIKESYQVIKLHTKFIENILNQSK